MNIGYILKKILLFPLDLFAVICGGIPPSYYDDVQREAELDAERFKKNETECHMKYGMSMLEKIRSVEKEIKGEDEFKKVQADCAKYMDQWCHLEMFHDLMCRTEGMFDVFLKEFASLWKREAEREKAMKVETEIMRNLISDKKVTRDAIYASWCRAWLLDENASKQKWNDYCAATGKSKSMMFELDRAELDA